MDENQEVSVTLPGWAQSSIDATQLSKTIEGILKALSAFIIGILAHYGLSFSTDQYLQVVSNITQVVSAAVTTWGIIETVHGSGRKVLMRGIKR